MKLLVIVTTVLLAGCFHSAPVKRTFPNVPDPLMEPCPPLKEAAATEKLSEVLKVVVDNYGEYHKCSGRVDAWQQWYKQQKQIFNEVK